MYKGKIVLVPFPFTDLSQYKVRPCLILHSSLKGEDCVVAFISSRKERGNFNVPIRASVENGIKANSIVKVDKIATLQKKIIIGELGILEPATMLLVEMKLKSLFKI